MVEMGSLKFDVGNSVPSSTVFRGEGVYKEVTMS